MFQINYESKDSKGSCLMKAKNHQEALAKVLKDFSPDGMQAPIMKVSVQLLEG